MKKGFLFIFLLTVAIILVSCSSNAGPASQPAASSPNPAAAAAGQGAVSIENFSFNPATLTVQAGTTVVWTNNDGASHDIKLPDLTSPAIPKGGTFEFKFDKAGTYDYICGIHPAMKGQIIVQ